METGVFRVIFHSLTPFEELLLPLVGFFKLPDAGGQQGKTVSRQSASSAPNI